MSCRNAASMAIQVGAVMPTDGGEEGQRIAETGGSAFKTTLNMLFNKKLNGKLLGKATFSGRLLQCGNNSVLALSNQNRK